MVVVFLTMWGDLIWTLFIPSVGGAHAFNFDLESHKNQQPVFIPNILYQIGPSSNLFCWYLHHNISSRFTSQMTFTIFTLVCSITLKQI